jgi:hypothetical protein
MKLVIDIPDAVPPSEVSREFMQGMADRMGVSYFKYGLVSEAYPAKVDAIKSLEQRLERYRATGNTEWLMDVANFAMIEHGYPRHSAAHFRGTDSHESPGRIGASGESIGATSNTSGRDNVRLGGSNMTTAGGHYTKEGD